MKTQKKRLGLRGLALTLISILFAGVAAGCSADIGGATQITFWAGVSQYNSAYYREMVDNYNAGQGKIDGVYVRYSAKSSDYSSNLTGILRSKNPPDVVIIHDKFFKRGYIQQGYLAELDGLLNNSELTTYNSSGGKHLDLSDIPEKMVYRFRFDKEAMQAGDDSNPLFGIPNGSRPQMLFYNKTYFDDAAINIISVPEDKLSDYNAANGTSYQPHGYAEYLYPPSEGLRSSQNLRNETVYKVFNNQIAMNWDELRTLSMYFTKAYRSASPSTYGFITEWWFSYGWSVGGDCIDWDEDDGQYKFTLGSRLTNYLVTADLEINGRSYAAGQLLGYNDKKFVSENISDSTIAGYLDSGALYSLPSQYDAFAEFCALSQAKDVAVDSLGKTGYGISPSPAKLRDSSKVTYFASGNVAMLAETYVNINTIAKAMTTMAWDVAPLIQYREYENGSLADDGYLKVIGGTYDGQIYTGALKVINGTPIVGEKSAASSNYCYSIAQNSANKEAAWKFIQYAAGVEGQRVLAKGNDIIPNQMSYAVSDEFLKSDYRLYDNLAAAVDASKYATIGDWSYLEDQEWVNYWADILNTDVRNGEMTLDSFFQQVQANVDDSLTRYRVRIMRR